MINDRLPPNVGKHECQRKDGSYGYVCNACGYSVGDHDGYCSECGARVAGTLFYYGKCFIGRKNYQYSGAVIST